MQSTLPDELLNEPHTYEDNGCRVTITVPRPKFQFAIEDQVLFSSCNVPDYWPSKTESNVNILNVYDAYGLESYTPRAWRVDGSVILGWIIGWCGCSWYTICY